MLRISPARILRVKSTPAAALVLALPALLVGIAIAAQDKYTLQIPDGLAFSDFRGYENWEDVAVSQTEMGMKVIVANPVMMDAFRSGLPASGKIFPEGSKIAKIEWTFKKNEVSPYFVNVPDKLKSLAFIEKDTKRFPNTHGWAYAQWDYDAATDTLMPSKLGPSGAECGFACHTIVSAQDYIFTAYPKR
jgi:Cytochrome P460